MATVNKEGKSIDGIYYPSAEECAEIAMALTGDLELTEYVRREPENLAVSCRVDAPAILTSIDEF